MKRFIIIVTCIVVAVVIFDSLYFRLGWYIDFDKSTPVTTFVKADSKKIYLDSGKGYEEFEIRGVNMGSGEPGQWATDFHIDYDTYLRWFRMIQEMGANTIRIYTIQSDVFYNAFYDYNSGNDNPLYLIQGVWVNDYIQNSHRSAYDPEFYEAFLSNCKTMVDVIHGKKKISLGRMADAGSGVYLKDISQWVIGYILGVEWEDVTVSYTDRMYEDIEAYSSYEGRYLYTAPEATPFESMLALVGDKVLEYESERYHQQRLFAFANWPTTDPFTYPENVSEFFMKCAYVDVEHIKSTDKVIAGQFATYHVYPYYPDYLSYFSDWSSLGIANVDDFVSEDGVLNTYRAYLTMLTNHHSLPVVISEFGVSTGRGMAQRDQNTGRNQGNMSESEQGLAIVDCWEDIKASGCVGGCVFSWQDEWFKRTWNTMYAVNLRRTPYWSDYQTNEQYFGLLSFDPGTEKSVCYVDGDVSEWGEEDVVLQEPSMMLSMKYDEKFIYFYIKQENFDFSEDKLYIPIDVTPKTGSNYCDNYGLKFDRAVDFLLVIDGKENSRLMVQERYESLRANFSEFVYGRNTYYAENIPDANSPLFVNIDMILQMNILLMMGQKTEAETYETGKLTYGNANPSSDNFNSLADFCVSGDDIEVKLPWQLLNFADPSNMEIHDDYYDGNYGVEYIRIDSIYVGAAADVSSSRILLEKVPLKGWKNRVTYHERLKDSYYVLQSLWKEGE